VQAILTVLVAVAPPVLFLVWILRYDRTEPEPLGMVLGMVLTGCLSVIPAGILESLVLLMPVFDSEGIAGKALQSFLVVAPLEEALKLLMVMLFAWKSRHFNERNDGIVYTGAVAIGFALAENIFYVFQFGLGTGFARAVTAIPGHTFSGVLMGYFIGQARFAATLPRRNTLIVKGFITAWLLHGTYNTLALSGTEAALLVVPMTALYFVLGIRFLKKGRAISLARWRGEAPETPARTIRGRWKKILGRVLLGASGIAWLLILLGLAGGAAENTGEAAMAVAGLVMITAIPITAGVLLEMSSPRG
jgi:protease PrsW